MLFADEIGTVERLVTNYGLPTALLLVVLYGGYRLCSVLVRGHVDYLGRTATAFEQQTGTMQSIDKNQAAIANQLTSGSVCRATCPGYPPRPGSA